MSWGSDEEKKKVLLRTACRSQISSVKDLINNFIKILSRIFIVK